MKMMERGNSTLEWEYPPKSNAPPDPRTQGSMCFDEEAVV